MTEYVAIMLDESEMWKEKYYQAMQERDAMMDEFNKEKPDWKESLFHSIEAGFAKIGLI